MNQRIRRTAQLALLGAVVLGAEAGAVHHVAVRTQSWFAGPEGEAISIASSTAARVLRDAAAERFMAAVTRSARFAESKGIDVPAFDLAREIRRSAEVSAATEIRVISLPAAPEDCCKASAKKTSARRVRLTNAS
jgi:hypothetical protein